MKKTEEYFAYLLTIIIFLIGLLLISLSFIPFISRNDLVSNIIRGLGIALCPAGVIGFLYQYYTQKVFSEKVESLIKNNLLIPQELGMRRIYKDRSEFSKQRLKLYSEAKEISYLSIMPGFGKPYDTVTEFLKLLKKGVNFRVLACSPSLSFAPQLFFVLGYKPAMLPIKETIVDSIRNMLEIKSKNTGGGKFEVKIYKLLPSWYIQIIDNIIFAEPYLYGVRGDKSLVLEIAEGTCYEHFKRHFNNIWKKAIDIDKFIKKNPL